jgi:protein ImuB
MMKRVASLYLPNLAIDLIARSGAGPPPKSSLGLAREDLEDSSSPRGGGWRPGARWAREIGKAVPLRHAGGGALLVTAHKIGNWMEIAAASPEARALGLHPGMNLAGARAMIPGLVIEEAAPEAEKAVLRRLALFAARRWTPRAAVAGADGLWLDLDGAAHLFGGEEAMCRHILLFCARAGFSARIAVAATPGAAHALARHGRQSPILCPAGREAEAIADFPLAALRLDEEIVAAARRLGIDRIGQLAAMPRGPLQRRFGKSLLLRLDQALGRASEPFDPIVLEAAPDSLLRFSEPIATAEAIEAALGRMMLVLAGKLARRHLGVRRLALLCGRVDGEVQQVAIGTARPTRDPGHLLRLLAARIETIEPGFGIETMRLVALRCEKLAPQPVAGAFAGADPEPDLAPLVDRLAARLGERRLYRWSAIESDVPERSVRRVGPFAAARSWPDWPRPIRLLSPAEPVDQVMAAMPDHPPRRFRWRGRVHHVRRADGPERIHGEWWKRSGEADAVRDYFQVEDEEGERFWLYRRGDGEDLRTGDLSWWLQGAFG